MVRSGFLQEFMPHGMCYMWRLDILLSHVISDALIALSYFTIASALYFFMRTRPEFLFRRVVIMFSIFIFSCGLTHLFAIWTVWHGDYGVQALLKSATAIASIATAIMLIPATPKLMALRSPEELEATNSALIAEISEREKMERESRGLALELAHSDRINAMGQMAAGLAHELNQPLTSLVQNADALKTASKIEETKSDAVMQIVDEMEAQATRASDIIRALRQLMYKDDGSRERVDLSAVIEQTLRLLEPSSISQGTSLVFESVGEVTVQAARVQIAQVVMNIIRNALDAFEPPVSGEEQITVACVPTDAGAEISVTDNGRGIAGDLDVFAPFESSKRQGMGIGLSICKSIVTAHDGEIWHEPAPGGGTRFVFTLSNEGQNRV